MCGSARNSIVEKLAFWGSKGPLGGGYFSMVEIFSNFVFFVMRTPFDSEYIVSLQKIDKKFFVLRYPWVPPWEVIFSMVEMCSNLCVFIYEDPIWTATIKLVSSAAFLQTGFIHFQPGKTLLLLETIRWLYISNYHTIIPGVSLIVAIHLIFLGFIITILFITYEKVQCG